MVTGIDCTAEANMETSGPGPSLPVPEASTVTVLFAALFVGGLVFLRVRQRRQLALASVQA